MTFVAGPAPVLAEEGNTRQIVDMIWQKFLEIEQSLQDTPTEIELSAGGQQTVRVIAGTGSPETNVVADIGSVFLRFDGGAATALYVKESGTGNTGWVGK